jgi:NAD(P)-dependent dehydrogenase (short-subunit alcohol dehydrogenase family)
MDLQLSGKVALVTGGGGGVGAAICRALAEEGVRVAVADLNADAAQSVARAINGLAVPFDVADRSAVEAGVARTAEEWGELHIVVSNVGLTLPDLLADIDDKDIATTFGVNMGGPLNVTRAAVKYLSAAGWGRLIFIGSSSGLKASAGLALYSSSKYFLHGLTVAAGLELGAHNITANILCPSDIYPAGDTPAGSWLNPKLIETSLQKEGVSSLAELQERRIAKSPIKRSCTVEDVANATVFLASPLAGFINAQAIGINGGSLPT